MNAFFAALFAVGVYSADCDPKLNKPVTVPSASGYSVELEPNTTQRFCTPSTLTDPTFAGGGSEGNSDGGSGSK